MSVMAFDRPEYLREEEIVLFTDSVGKFFDQHAPEERVAKWRRGQDRRARDVARGGRGGAAVPVDAGSLWRRPAAIIATRSCSWSRSATKGVDGFGASLHNAIVAPYILHYGSEEQKRRWLPRMATGELVGAIAMSEPGAGSDLQGVRTSATRSGNQYVVNGQKTFITNGQTANLVIVVAKTDPSAGAKGTSLIVVETEETEGFRARAASSTRSGLTRRTPPNCSSTRRAFRPRTCWEPTKARASSSSCSNCRRSGSTSPSAAWRSIERALQLTIDYVKERHAFGKRILDFQNTQFVLAECKTEANVGRAFVDRLIGLHLERKLDAATASMAKYWISDLECKIVDRCLQLFGGYGFMNEYPIGRMFRDTRVQRIYGGDQRDHEAADRKDAVKRADRDAVSERSARRLFR